VQSITLPNNRNIVIMALALFTSATPTVIPGTYVYTPPAGTIPAIGTDPLSVVFTPSSPAYGTATASVNLIVTKGSLLVTANSQSGAFGTPLAP
jgi:hypothetical protein